MTGSGYGHASGHHPARSRIGAVATLALTLVWIVGASACAGSTPTSPAPGATPAPTASIPPPDPATVLLFTRTTGFHHASIEQSGVGTIEELGVDHGFTVETTADESVFTDAGLDRFDVVVLLSTTGDPIATEGDLLATRAHRTALEAFVRDGGGVLAIHAATDQDATSRSEWPWFGRLLGTYFSGHPAWQGDAVHPEDTDCGAPLPAGGLVVTCHTGTVVVEDGRHPATAAVPARWPVYDEFYGFDPDPRPNVHVLLTLDEASYDDRPVPFGNPALDPRPLLGDPAGTGSFMPGGDHPIAWCQEFEGGRSIYVGLGHANALYRDPVFRTFIAGSIRWAAGLDVGDCSG